MKENEKERRWRKVILVLYVLIIIRLIVFKYPYSELRQIAGSWQKDVILEGLDTANFMPFKTIKMYIRYYGRLNSFENLFGNILIFIPFGYLLPWAFKRYRNFFRAFLITFLFVACIEIVQLFSAFGAFDVDDFILNCFGGCIGFGLYQLLSLLRKR